MDPIPTKTLRLLLEQGFTLLDVSIEDVIFSLGETRIDDDGGKYELVLSRDGDGWTAGFYDEFSHKLPLMLERAASPKHALIRLWQEDWTQTQKFKRESQI